MLVGTQIDLRDDPQSIEKLAKNKQRPISFELGERLAKELKAVKYVECSALTQVICVFFIFWFFFKFFTAYILGCRNFFSVFFFFFFFFFLFKLPYKVVFVTVIDF